MAACFGPHILTILAIFWKIAVWLSKIKPYTGTHWIWCFRIGGGEDDCIRNKNSPKRVVYGDAAYTDRNSDKLRLYRR